MEVAGWPGGCGRASGIASAACLWCRSMIESTQACNASAGRIRDSVGWCLASGQPPCSPGWRSEPDSSRGTEPRDPHRDPVEGLPVGGSLHAMKMKTPQGHSSGCDPRARASWDGGRAITNCMVFGQKSSGGSVDCIRCRTECLNPFWRSFCRSSDFRTNCPMSLAAALRSSIAWQASW